MRRWPLVFLAAQLSRQQQPHKRLHPDATVPAGTAQPRTSSANAGAKCLHSRVSFFLSPICGRVARAEVSSVAPHAVEYDSHLARERDARFLEAGALCKLEAPALEWIGATRSRGKVATCCRVEERSDRFDLMASEPLVRDCLTLFLFCSTNAIRTWMIPTFVTASSSVGRARFLLLRCPRKWTSHQCRMSRCRLCRAQRLSLA